MASFWRSALMASSRSMAARSKILIHIQKPKAMSYPFSRTSASPSRIVSVLGSVESMMPFHSATANVRLISNIAVDSSCWSWLSRGLATPL